MNKKAEEFIKRKKRKKALRKIILGVFLLAIGVILFMYKAPIFNVKNIVVNGVVTLNESEIKEELQGYIGKNIFMINYKDMKNIIGRNPYVKDLNITRSGINGIRVIIEENTAAFFIKSGDVKKIISNDLVLLENSSSIDGKKIVELLGVQENGKNLGEVIVDNKYISTILNDFYPIIMEMPEEYMFTSIDVSDITNIKGKIGNVTVLLGDSENLVNKMNLVLNAIEQGVISKGYINVGFNGTPVIKQEN